MRYEMEDYNHDLYKHEGNFCKYSYSSWCSMCEGNSPRRRSRSETLELCQRKNREMKSLTPKKYNRSQEYENMEFEYESRGQWQEKDMRYEYSRIRSNLCELPTSYISNNCQNLNVAGLPKLSKDSSDFVDCLKSVGSYEHTLKLVDLNDHIENLGSMQVKNKETFNKINPNKVDGLRYERKLDSRNHLKTNCLHTKSPIKNLQEQLKYNHNEIYIDNHCTDYKNPKIPEINTSNCREYCTLVDLKFHNLSNERPLCFDTGTYFDKRCDTTSIHEQYNSEVEYLRERLKMLHNNSYSNYNSFTKVDKCVSTVDPIPNYRNSGSITKHTPAIRNKMKCRIQSPPLNRRRSKISVKTKTKGSANNFKIKSKPTSSISTSSNCAESDYSGSDSENETNLGEDDNVSEQSTDESNKDSANGILQVGSHETDVEDAVQWPVRCSLFPHIPPYICFTSHDSETEAKIPNGKKFLKWKLSTITPVIVRKTLTNSGFALVRKSNQWLGTWGKHMKSPMFRTLRDYQKLNHFPGTFQLGRKDRLWRNFQRMISRYGHKEFGFLPHTYILPQEIKLLKQSWEFKNGSGGEMWIIKPPASARGVGIKVINKWSQLPKKTSIVVQKYISNPYLINGSKFDLRLYVVVTSFHPLTIYLYPDGLARFASAKYSDDAKDLKDRYMHLTNYSINKLSSQYTANEDANACQGHKWTLSKLMEYLEEANIDTTALWKNLKQLVIKTIIACEAPIVQLCEENMNNKYNCYELFGIDVLLDENLKPWLLEVNISPSLHSSSPLDSHIKGPLVQTLFEMAQFHLPRKLHQTVGDAPQCFDPKIYTTSLSKKERNKHVTFTQYESRQDYLEDILRNLTGDDVRHLTRAEDEYVAKGRFERIFPNGESHKYLPFIEARYYNRLFDAWEAKYGSRREEGIELLRNLCAQKLHLKVSSPSTFSKARNFMLATMQSVCSQCRKFAEYDPFGYQCSEFQRGTESPSRRHHAEGNN
ncbi:tubulin monoglutamylase TTLL4 isoform X2 [Leptinotarsa decemlineata]|uniref:tubulin monoglutamylase TTLL4 isoform X2 n=1 Tax=Leptinotarsa decemlineata TaxID=7539 RepID=UPI003D30421B